MLFWSVEFTPDGLAIVTRGQDGRVSVWDRQSRQAIQHPLLSIIGTSSFSFGPSRNEILVGGSASAQRWDLGIGMPVGPMFRHGSDSAQMILHTAIAASHERFLTTAQDGTAKLWDTSGTMLAELIHQNSVRHGRFSPDSTLLITVSDDRMARIWDANSGAPLVTLTHENQILAAVFADNHRVITGSRVGAQLWDVPLQRRLGPSCQYQHAVVDVSCISDGKTALLADWDGYGIVWSIPEPIPGDADTIMLWVQTEVGMQLDDAGGREVLSGTAWLEYRDRLLIASSNSHASPVTLHASP